MTLTSGIWYKVWLFSLCGHQMNFNKVSLIDKVTSQMKGAAFGVYIALWSEDLYLSSVSIYFKFCQRNITSYCIFVSYWLASRLPMQTHFWFNIHHPCTLISHWDKVCHSHCLWNKVWPFTSALSYKVSLLHLPFSRTFCHLRQFSEKHTFFSLSDNIIKA